MAAEGVRDVGHPPGHLVVVAGDASEHQGLAAVARAKRGGRAQRPVADGTLDVRGAEETQGDVSASGASSGVVDAARPGGDDQHDVGVAGVELVVEGVGCEGGLSARIVEAAAAEPCRNPAAEGK